MKQILSSILIALTAAIICLPAYANRVIVKGHVRYANGNAVSYQLVTIATDTTAANACRLVHQKYTNSSGYYTDTLECATNIEKLRISAANCNGTLLINNPPVPVSGVVESNFTLCNPVAPTPTNCVSLFSFQRSSNTLAVSFNSTASAGTTPADIILRRRWKFGTGDTLGGNVVNPSYTYPQRGIFETCLTIWTAAGCEKTSCQAVNITDSIPPAASCISKFTYQKAASSLAVIFTSGSSSGITPGDSILRRRWKFGTGDTLGGNVVSPSYTYTQRGIYETCLTIWTAAGCEKTSCQAVNITDSEPPPASCMSKFTYQKTANSLVVNFNSGASSGVTPADSVLRRRWRFGNGDTLGGNVISPSYMYPQRGAYEACLTIWTASGCEKTSCQSISLIDSTPVLRCYSRFTYSLSSLSTNVAPYSVKFNSSTSEASAADTIRERIWSFGDGSSLTGNISDPTHPYLRDGLYSVCLTIKTTRGCQSQGCKQVIVTGNSLQCVSAFTSERLAPKKARFNSGTSYTSAGDSIIERRWDFGDGSILSGNVINPLKEYVSFGNYNGCLKIRTSKGCEKTFCGTVRLQDSSGTTPSNEVISILSVSPNPAITQTQTVVWSRYNNIAAELAVYDIYGVKKWSLNKSLQQGNNITVLPIGSLLAGPYFFRVTTMYGIKTGRFYKL